MVEPLWIPDPDRARTTQIAGLARMQGFDGAAAVHDLWEWSVDEHESFWRYIVKHSVIASHGHGPEFDPGPVLVDGDRMPGARWFPELELNFTENLLRRRDATPAIIFRGENGSRRELSWIELGDAVASLAASLRADGVGPGDRVAGFLPNAPEAVIGMLATASLGAVWSSCSPDFGTAGVLDRFGQIEPKVLLAADGYHYAGKRLDIRPKVAAIAQALPSLRRTVVTSFLEAAPDLAGIAKAVAYADYLTLPAPPLAFTRVPFDHPLYVLYSSGTTGKPKAIVHGVGGTLVQHLKEHQLHTDVRPGSRLFYFTTCGWMMWNWLVSGLASEATIVLFDGSPFHPSPDILFDIAAEERLDVLGTSAKFIDAVKKAGRTPMQTHDLANLKAILSTGSPLVAESFEWVYGNVKRDLQLASISGGTDIVSCFVLGNPAGPVFAGEIQMRGLGMAVEIRDQTGRPVRSEKGELVCTKPFPSMPVSFWNDPDGSRYRNSYFARFPGIWCHGDYAELTEHDGIVIHGRSDAVLNPGGVRIGTAEIYRQVEQIPEVLESICIGQEWDGDVRVVLFVRLREGVVLDDALGDRIKRQIRDNCTPRHVPARIVAVTDIPRTLSGKITELAVRDVVHGRAVSNTDALANPQALELYRDLPELAG
jgi:acetoacetyl-CoA synthetase